MSTLILLNLDDEDQARGAFEKIQDLHDVALLRLTGAAKIDIAKDGHLNVTTAAHDSVAPVSMVPLAAFGIILGALMSTPLFGFAVAGTLGAVFEKHRQGNDTPGQQFRDQASKALKPGTWAVVVYASEVAHDELRRQLEPFGGVLLVTDVSDDDERALAADLGVKR